LCIPDHVACDLSVDTRPAVSAIIVEFALADILVQCPRTGAPVPTGLKTEWVFLKSLPCVAVPLRCPACGQVHKWKPDDAWIGSARPPTGPDLLRTGRAPMLAAAAAGAAKTPECD